MNRFISFISYLIRSFHLHGIHSPFVFNLVNDVFRSKFSFYAFDEIESIRAKLLLTDKKIKVEDHGAKEKTQYEKSIKGICRDSSQKVAFAQLIYRLAKEHDPSTILELGSSFGLTTAYLAKACPKAKVISLEGAEEVHKIAEINLKKLNIHNVKLIQGTFDDHLKQVINELGQIDFAYIDGHHQKSATLQYFKEILERTHDKSVLVFDDIYWSKGMKEAWKEIKKNPRVVSTIDLFQIGIVYFDPELTRQHYTVYHSANFNLN